MNKLDKLHILDFNKRVLNKGKFEQYAISPYASEEKHMKKVLILSDKVSNPTNLCSDGDIIALIVPYQDNLNDIIRTHSDIITSHTGVDATYFGIFTLDGEFIQTFRKWGS